MFLVKLEDDGRRFSVTTSFLTSKASVCMFLFEGGGAPLEKRVTFEPQEVFKHQNLNVIQGCLSYLFDLPSHDEAGYLNSC